MLKIVPLPVGKCTIFSAEKGKAEGCGVALYKGGGWACTAGSTVWGFEKYRTVNGLSRMIFNRQISKRNIKL